MLWQPEKVGVKLSCKEGGWQAEDMDELQFEVGEVIDVVEYEDPEEQVELHHIKLDHETGLDKLLVSGGRVADGGSVLDGPEGTFPGQFHSTHLILKQHPVSPATPLRVAPNPSPSLKPHDSDVMEVKLKDPDPLTRFYKKVNQTCSKVTEEK